MARTQTRQVTSVRHINWFSRIAAVSALAVVTLAAAARGQDATWQPRSATVPLRLHATSRMPASIDGLCADAVDGYLDQTDFLSAALIAGGVTDGAALDRLTRRFDRWVEMQSTQLAEVRDPVERARWLLHALHRDWFTGQYYAACARVDQTLSNGHFNCVTATVLFHVAAQRLGLPDVLVSVPGHVFNRLALTDPVDVQTTSATWLDPGANRPTVPEGRQRLMSEVQLIGKLFYNHGVALLSQSRYARAAEQFRRALAWDPQDISASQNLLAALNNGALAAAEQRDYAAAMGLLEQGLRFDPSFAPLAANYQHVADQWIEELLADVRPDAARRVIAEVEGQLPAQQYWLATQRRGVAAWQAAQRATATASGDGWYPPASDVSLTTAAP